MPYILFFVIVFVFLHLQSVCPFVGWQMIEHLDGVIPILKLRKSKARDNEQTNAHVHDMLPKGYYHNGRGRLFIILQRQSEALGLIMATEHAFIYSICSTSV